MQARTPTPFRFRQVQKQRVQQIARCRQVEVARRQVQQVAIARCRQVEVARREAQQVARCPIRVAKFQSVVQKGAARCQQAQQVAR